VDTNGTQTHDDTDTENDEWEDDVEQQPPSRCPACRHTQLGDYLWGFIDEPPEDPETRIVGCLIDDETPRWFCKNCDADILEDGSLKRPSGN
jgi:hypothetical protein